DGRRIEQVLDNVFVNALRYVPRGGHVTIALSPESGRAAYCLTVADDGPGIPERELPLVFQRFYRAAAGPARTGVDAGSGLGLVGALIGLALLWHDLPEMAARRHTDVRALLGHDLAAQLQLGFLLVVALGDVLAWAGLEAGWPLAGAGVLGGTLRAALGGKWLRLVNPLHVLCGGMWIGTLLMLVVVGLPAVLRAPLPPGRRGAAVAQ